MDNSFGPVDPGKSVGGTQGSLGHSELLKVSPQDMSCPVDLSQRSTEIKAEVVEPLTHTAGRISSRRPQSSVAKLSS